MIELFNSYLMTSLICSGKPPSVSLNIFTLNFYLKLHMNNNKKLLEIN